MISLSKYSTHWWESMKLGIFELLFYPEFISVLFNNDILVGTLTLIHMLVKIGVTISNIQHFIDIFYRYCKIL